MESKYIHSNVHVYKVMHRGVAPSLVDIAHSTRYGGGVKIWWWCQDVVVVLRCGGSGVNMWWWCQDMVVVSRYGGGVKMWWWCQDVVVVSRGSCILLSCLTACLHS